MISYAELTTFQRSVNVTYSIRLCDLFVFDLTQKKPNTECIYIYLFSNSSHVANEVLVFWLNKVDPLDVLLRDH